MKKMYENVSITQNIEIAPDIYRMVLYCPEAAREAKAGQFVGLYTGGAERLLPRPISICLTDEEAGTLTLVYQVVGGGTRCFSQMPNGNSLRMLAVLGNGFDITDADSYCIVGGGIGAPPMAKLAADIKRYKPDAAVRVFLGFRSGEILTEYFRDELKLDVQVATDDGSVGFKGNVVELLKHNGISDGIIYACGPRPMLRALSGYASERGIPCRVSMEERMACGIGACVGCAIKIKTGDGWEHKKVCKDGPVFDSNEVIWDE